MAGDLLKEGLTVVGLLIVLFSKDWRLALLSLVGMPLAFYPLVRLGRAPARLATRPRCGAGATSRRSCRRRSRASAW